MFCPKTGTGKNIAAARAIAIKTKPTLLMINFEKFPPPFYLNGGENILCEVG